MKSSAQKDLATEIIKSWLKPRSNYILVAPPMSGSKCFFKTLTCNEYLYGVVGEVSTTFAIASLDTLDFQSELIFARSISSKWGVADVASAEDDPLTILDKSIEAVIKRKKIPILVVQRFHEALKKLGEEIGTHLRNLEHWHNLKTVVEMPVSLTVLRERWESVEAHRAPFLASDWGQGHSHKLLKGYSFEEIFTIAAANKLHESASEIIYTSTGGLIELVDWLVPDLSGKKDNGITMFIKSRSQDLCGRLVRWVDAQNSAHIYKKSVINLLESSLYSKATASLKFHDWSEIVLNKSGALNCKMLAWASLTILAKQSELTFINSCKELFVARKHQEASSIIDVLINSDQKNADSWKLIAIINEFCLLVKNVFADNGEWGRAQEILTLLAEQGTYEVPPAVKLDYLFEWQALISFLTCYFMEIKARPGVRIEIYLCTKYDLESIYPFVQLLKLRLQYAGDLEAYQSLQSIVTQPESLLQIYSFYKFGIKFWKFEGLSDQERIKVSEFSRKNISITTKGNALGYVELLYLIASRSLTLPESERLILGYQEVEKFERMYEIRKDQVHSTTFVQRVLYDEYREFCSVLIERFWKCLFSCDFSHRLVEANYSIVSLLDLMVVDTKSR